MRDGDWATITDLLQEACFELWQGFDQPVSMIEHDDAGLDDALAACIGFTGDSVRGSLGIAGAAEVFQKTHPLVANQVRPSEDEMLDWCSEVSNQLLGRLKNKLVPFGVTLAMSVPSAMSAGRIRFHERGAVDGRGGVNAYRVGHARFLVSLGAQVEHGFVLGPRASEHETIRESEMIEF